MRRIMLFGAALTLSLAAASPAVAADYAQTALNIVPSGQPGAIPAPAGAATQAQMYDSLTPLRGNVSAANLLTAFKSERFGSDDSCPCTPESVPRPGVTIIRDRFDVPHITGVTNDDVTWATGWVLEEDRGLLLSQGRYPGRYAALDVPGVNAFSLVTGLKPTTASKQADAIIDKTQTASLNAAGAEGKAVLHDIDVYVAGINARLKAEGSTQKPWTRVDVYSLNALAGQIFGQGGGDEARRSEMLSGLEKKLGKTNGKKAFDDLSEHLDRDTPTTISNTASHRLGGLVLTVRLPRSGKFSGDQWWRWSASQPVRSITAKTNVTSPALTSSDHHAPPSICAIACSGFPLATISPTPDTSVTSRTIANTTLSANQ